MQWTGEERRSIPQVTREEFVQFVAQSNAQRQELRDMVREIRATMIEIQRDIKCVHETWDTHVAEYGDMLKNTKKARQDREKLRSAILEKSLTGAVLAMVVFVATALWDYVKSQVK